MRLDELILEVNNQGLRINNLFQLHDLRWQANLTDGERFWEFGRGESALQALQAALAKHSTTTPVMGMKSTATAAPRISTDLTGITL